MVSVRAGLIDVFQQMGKFLCPVKNYTFVPWFDTSTDAGGGGGGRKINVTFCKLGLYNKPVLYLPATYNCLCPIH
jgi:hypothetical protein